jgi:hypothetical protein
VLRRSLELVNGLELGIMEHVPPNAVTVADLPVEPDALLVDF